MHIQQNIMTTAELKKMFRAAEGAPVNCAVGSIDSSSVIVMSKLKSAKTLENTLKHLVPHIQSTYFGSVICDLKTVKITLNKPALNLSRRLAKAIKGTGWTKVEVNGDVYEDIDEVNVLEEPAISPAARFVLGAHRFAGSQG